MPTNAPLTIVPRYLAPHVTPEMVATWQPKLALAYQTLMNGTGEGSDFRGWLDPTQMVTDTELAEIETVAADLRSRSDVLVSVGIGGSYLGARAVIEALAPVNSPNKVEFAGQNLSARYHADLIARLEGKRVAVNAISKSGTTTEPAVAFRLLRPLASSDDLIVATTDRKRGALRKVADTNGWKTFPIDDAVGGRYSVLSAVGLLPIAYAGVDIRALRAGAIACAKLASEPNPLKNPILFYAAARNMLYSQGAMVEVLANFEPRLHFIAEWWKQLFGESEGKNHSSLFPASVDMTTDLHSMGQYLQEGRRFMLETFITIGEEGDPTLAVPDSVPAGDNTDELGYLVGIPLTQINHAAYEATALAHYTGGLPNLTIHLEKLDAYSLGFLLYFFECACGVSGYLLGVNPFDQPGVEAYKKNMFALLEKPGYEAQTKAIKEATSGEIIRIGF